MLVLRVAHPRPTRRARGRKTADGRGVAHAYLQVAVPGNLLLCLVLFVPFVHLPAFAEEAGVAPTAAAGLVGIVGATSILGRVALGAVADGAGLLRGYRVSFFPIGASFALWWFGDGFWFLAAFAAVLGIVTVGSWR